jgi:hypothetical protein
LFSPYFPCFFAAAARTAFNTVSGFKTLLKNSAPVASNTALASAGAVGAITASAASLAPNGQCGI